MTRRPRRNHTPSFKAKVILVAMTGERSLTELAQRFDSLANQIVNRNRTLMPEWATAKHMICSETHPTGGASSAPIIHAKKHFM